MGNEANSSCTLSADKVRDRVSLNHELQHAGQGLLVTHKESLSLSPFYQVTQCDQASFTFVRSAGAHGDQNAISPDHIIIEWGPLSSPGWLLPLWWQSITVLMACGGSPLEF